MPTHSSLPDPVPAFLERYIDSVEQLEVLLLAAQNPAQWWTASSVATRLATSPQSAQARLEDLCAKGFLEVRTAEDVLFRYAPNPDLASPTAAVAEAYRTYRVAVITAIYARPTEPLRDFADAFRIRKDKDNDNG